MSFGIFYSHLVYFYCHLVYFSANWNILTAIFITFGSLEYFMVIWYIFVPKKIWQPLSLRSGNDEENDKNKHPAVSPMEVSFWCVCVWQHAADRKKFFFLHTNVILDGNRLIAILCTSL
jgi:hypothetical protein